MNKGDVLILNIGKVHDVLFFLFIELNVNRL